MANDTRVTELWHNREPLSKWLSTREWDYFCTITAKHELTEKSARRVMEAMKARMESAGNGSPKFKQGKGHVFWVAEPHKHSASGYHLHLIMKVPERISRIGRRTRWQFILDSARRAVGGEPWLNQKGQSGLWHRVEVQDFKGWTCVDYCTKYVTKNINDWDFLELN